uniref:Uncharacterized protein n=1 Tax=Neobodo designis TaxID=312471 RepID=A0A7S1M809_NEODS
MCAASLFTGQLLFTTFPALAPMAPAMRTFSFGIVVLLTLWHVLQSLPGDAKLLLTPNTGAHEYAMIVLIGFLFLLAFAHGFLQDLAPETADAATKCNAEFHRKVRARVALCLEPERFARVCAAAFAARGAPYRAGELDRCARMTLGALLHGPSDTEPAYFHTKLARAAGQQNNCPRCGRSCVWCSAGVNDEDPIADALLQDMSNGHRAFRTFYGVVPNTLVFRVSEQHPANFLRSLASASSRVSRALCIARLNCCRRSLAAEFAELLRPVADGLPDEVVVVPPGNEGEGSLLQRGSDFASPPRNLVEMARFRMWFGAVPSSIVVERASSREVYVACSAISVIPSHLKHHPARFSRWGFSCNKNAWFHVHESTIDTDEALVQDTFQDSGRIVLVRYALRSDAGVAFGQPSVELRHRQPPAFA